MRGLLACLLSVCGYGVGARGGSVRACMRACELRAPLVKLRLNDGTTTRSQDVADKFPRFEAEAAAAAGRAKRGGGGGRGGVGQSVQSGVAGSRGAGGQTRFASDDGDASGGCVGVLVWLVKVPTGGGLG